MIKNPDLFPSWMHFLLIEEMNDVPIFIQLLIVEFMIRRNQAGFTQHTKCFKWIIQCRWSFNLRRIRSKSTLVCT